MLNRNEHLCSIELVYACSDELSRGSYPNPMDITQLLYTIPYQATRIAYTLSRHQKLTEIILLGQSYEHYDT